MSKSSCFQSEGVKVSRERMQELVEAIGVDVAPAIQEGIEQYIASTRKFLLELLMQAESIQKCGRLYERDSNRNFVRWGTELGTALVGGFKTEVMRPRIRVARNVNGKGGEVQLETYKAMNRQDLIDGPLTAAILCGVSTRQYVSILQRGLEAKGVSKSTISRKGIAATKPTVDAFLKRRLEDLQLVVLLIDGINVAKRQMLACIGIDSNGRKHVLGTRLGSTENDIVCRDLIRDMIERGLSTEQKYLFVLDGSKALVNAVHAAFGQDAAIQRCQEHKIRNVQAYMPVGKRNEVRRKMQAAYYQTGERAALKRLEKFRQELLIVGGEKAANALVEGLYETLTVHRLGITGLLRKSLRTTNIIESAFSSVRRYMGRTTSFKNEKQIDRWVIRSLVEAERHFRTVEGNRQLPELRSRLNQAKR